IERTAEIIEEFCLQWHHRFEWCHFRCLFLTARRCPLFRTIPSAQGRADRSVLGWYAANRLHGVGRVYASRETTRVHHAAGQCGGSMAARGGRGAEVPLGADARVSLSNHRSTNDAPVTRRRGCAVTLQVRGGNGAARGGLTAVGCSKRLATATT